MSLLGPFWCQRDRAWVRFNIDQGKASAEIFQPQTNSTWQPVDQGSWPISYVHGEEEVTEVFYSLQGDVLYRTEGKPNRWEPEVFQASQYQVNDWAPYNISAERRKTGFYPFVEYQKDAAPLTPYHKLPLTPEAEQLKWEECRKSDLRALLVDEASRNTLFAGNEVAFDRLLNALNQVLFEYPPSEFNSCDEYLQFLKAVIDDYDNQLHRKIIDKASETDIDRDLGYAGSEKQIREMRELKKTFFFNLLRKETVYLCQEFNKECPILAEEEPVPIDQELIAVQRQPQPAQASPSFLHDFLINLMNFFVNHQDVLDRPNLPINNAEHLAAALEGSRYEAMQEIDEDLTLLEQIKIAVSYAQTKYKEWYDDKAGAKEIRGRDGFFSRYSFRHGDSGQTRASDFKDSIFRREVDEPEAIILVNSLLQDSKTAYNRHSFASFLLDELKLINNGPWSAIAANSESNLYDQATVLTVLEAYEYPGYTATAEF
ncbi:hypothetical protein Lnau_2942 [Legionella nautarum]|uniref:Uncharacterized protein n=1 Tax=Legionella nautarum TaxID=45070 RepID=A0A0W0WLU9_9GAMM|nr:hypothetical protein [Legionella nautarum]KTD33294.1 hypothetical protein Lnau_2942 [Legionella nautarum]